jgi:hypothetical protein
MLDGGAVRFALVAVTPFLMTLTLVGRARKERGAMCSDALCLFFSLLLKLWWEVW